MARTISCPYAWCEASVEVRPERPSDIIERKGIIELHPISNAALTGNCPASLMHVPFTQHEHQALEERDRIDELKVQAWIEQPEHFQPTSDNQSQPLRGPHRLGREPNPRSSAWVRGGRADEDVPTEPQTSQPVPQGVAGQPLGGAMASIPEIVAAVNSAGAKGQEAHAAITTLQDQTDTQGRQVLDHIEQAIEIYQYILSQGESGRMSAAITSMRIAGEAVESALSVMRRELARAQLSINAAGEQNQEFIAAISA